jgi:hypothetical protein
MKYVLLLPLSPSTSIFDSPLSEHKISLCFKDFLGAGIALTVYRMGYGLDGPGIESR